MKSKGVCSLILLLGITLPLLSQPKVRADDHFWRKRIVTRISLVEKMNRPLVQHQSSYYGFDGRYSQTQGLVSSLIAGVKAGKYPAYDPDDWSLVYSYDELAERIRSFEQLLYPEEEASYLADEGAGESFVADDGWDMSTDDGWAGFDAAPEESPSTNTVSGAQSDLSAYEEVIHLVEDWVFDKNRSEMIYRPIFFEVIWADPSGALPERVLARFNWEEVREQMDDTLWKNRHNDAESLSMREVFELRRFNGIIIDMSGQGVRNVYEAEARRQEMIEFEHNLWSY